ncbi:HNH endonuclease [Nocardia takedensis]|uniref:HNH endonuclease n=1 Tax=Nocardia takedensis TaxID=259390 RepID=UPI003F765088
MPVRPPRVCNRCRRAAPAGRRCPCTPAWTSETNDYTGSGSTRRWRTTRAAYLFGYPQCECVWIDDHGQRRRCGRLADEVDHIIPVSRGGDRYDPDNLQSLCEEHHLEKTLRDAVEARTSAAAP